MARFRTAAGKVIDPGTKIEAGAAGVAMTVAGRPELVLKLLTAPTAMHEQRLQAMVSIDVPVRVPGAAAVIAWPSDLVYDEAGVYAGFLMPRAPGPGPVTLVTLAQRSEREKQLERNIGWNVLLGIAANYSAAVDTLHECAVVACDINLKNVVVSGDHTVTAIDCDSMQIVVAGRAHLSSYYQEEFLAPEFKGQNLSRVPRTPESDRWALAVLNWMVLMDGHHPFAGVWKGPGELERDDHVKAGRFPYGPKAGRLSPSPHAPPWRALSPRLQSLFNRTFTDGASRPELRVTAGEWSAALRDAAGGLVLCNGASGRQHYFPGGSGSCPWCEYEDYLHGPRVAPRPKARTAAVGSTTAPRGAFTTTRASTPVPPRRPPPSASPGTISKFLRSRLAVASFLVLVIVAAVLLSREDGSDFPLPGIPGGAGSANSAQHGGRSAPARAIASHYRALDHGNYRRAFGFMTPAYRHGHPGWLRQARSARPGINLVRVGHPRRVGGRAWVPIRMYRARHPRYPAQRHAMPPLRRAGPHGEDGGRMAL